MLHSPMLAEEASLLLTVDAQCLLHVHGLECRRPGRGLAAIDSLDAHVDLAQFYAAVCRQPALEGRMCEPRCTGTLTIKAFSFAAPVALSNKTSNEIATTQRQTQWIGSIDACRKSSLGKQLHLNE